MNFNISALIFLCVLGIGTALECYSCNATVSSKQDDPCKGRGSIVKCTDPAVCLSVAYSQEDRLSRQKQYSTFKSCYFKTGLGHECDTFLTAIRASNLHANIELTEKCKTCEDNGCNHASVITLPSFLLVVSLFCGVFNKFL